MHVSTLLLLLQPIGFQDKELADPCPNDELLRCDKVPRREVLQKLLPIEFSVVDSRKSLRSRNLCFENFIPVAHDAC